LSASTVVHKQKLIVPLPLETSPREEAVISGNLDIFQNNGFNFIIDENQPPGHRIKVTTLPLCQSVQFGVRDVHDLASLIDSIDGIFSDGDGRGEGGDACDSQIPNLVIKNIGGMMAGGNSRSREKRNQIKLPRLVSVFASKACRSSIMIGTHLKLHEMRNIVDNLGTIEQPWNCPHGRPTMRHLIDLKSMVGSDRSIFSSSTVNSDDCNEVENKRARIDKYRDHQT
jgi:DNA mismatch repair protein PMS2